MPIPRYSNLKMNKNKIKKRNEYAVPQFVYKKCMCTTNMETSAEFFKIKLK